MSKTYILDIDGTLLYHIDDFENIYNYPKIEPLPGASTKTAQWHCEGHFIVLTTARPESTRDITMKQLAEAGVFYDILVMGIGAGERILVNDYVTNHKAYAYNVVRNVDGIANVP